MTPLDISPITNPLITAEETPKCGSLRSLWHAVQERISPALEKGISINLVTRRAVGSVLSHFFNGHDYFEADASPAGVKIYGKEYHRLTFSIDTIPGLIFKIDLNRSVMDRRYERMQESEHLIKTHDLSCLVVPRAKKFSVFHDFKRFSVIAEQKLSTENTFEPTLLCIKQLAKFIILSKRFSDVTERNIPVLTQKDPQGNSLIGLIDLEEQDFISQGHDAVVAGLFGYKKSDLFSDTFIPGLLRCIKPEQAQCFIDEIKEQLDWSEEFEERSSKTLKKCQRDREYLTYAKENGIQFNTDEIQLDETKQSLLREESEDVLNVAQTIVEKFNTGFIMFNIERTHTGKRRFYFDPLIVSEEQRPSIETALNKLVELKAIFSWSPRTYYYKITT